MAKHFNLFIFQNERFLEQKEKEKAEHTSRTRRDGSGPKKKRRHSRKLRRSSSLESRTHPRGRSNSHTAEPRSVPNRTRSLSHASKKSTRRHSSKAKYSPLTTKHSPENARNRSRSVERQASSSRSVETKPSLGSLEPVAEQRIFAAKSTDGQPSGKSSSKRRSRATTRTSSTRNRSRSTIRADEYEKKLRSKTSRKKLTTEHDGKEQAAQSSKRRGFFKRKEKSRKARPNLSVAILTPTGSKQTSQESTIEATPCSDEKILCDCGKSVHVHENRVLCPSCGSALHLDFRNLLICGSFQNQLYPPEGWLFPCVNCLLPTAQEADVVVIGVTQTRAYLCNACERENGAKVLRNRPVKVGQFFVNQIRALPTRKPAARHKSF